MKLIKKMIPSLLVAGLLLCAVGCNSNKTDTNNTGGQDKTPAVTENGQTNNNGTTTVDPSAPSFVAGVEEWDDTAFHSTQPTTQSGQNGTQTQPTTQTTPTGSQGTTNQPTGDPTKPGSLTYAQYIALTTAQQQAYFQSFDSVDAFYDWLDAAEAAYEAGRDTVTGDGTLDLGDFVKNNS